jgi:hypothetical protein
VTQAHVRRHTSIVPWIGEKLSLGTALTEMSIIVLLLGSATVGLMIAPRHNVYVLLGSTPILAAVVATEAQLTGFGVLLICS